MVGFVSHADRRARLWRRSESRRAGGRTAAAGSLCSGRLPCATTIEQRNLHVNNLIDSRFDIFGTLEHNINVKDGHQPTQVTSLQSTTLSATYNIRDGFPFACCWHCLHPSSWKALRNLHGGRVAHND